MNITHALLCSTICTCDIAIITVYFIVLILYSIHVANARIQQFDDNAVNEDFYSYGIIENRKWVESIFITRNE